MSLQRSVDSNNDAGKLLEKVLIGNNLAGLSPVEKVKHITNVCDSLGLNPLTRPFQLINFQGKEIIYCTKDATEQLRKNNRVSITKIEKEILEGSIYIITVYGCTPDGRQDMATAVVSIKGLVGEALANAMMKAETKGKRRFTLSICGLGFLDESELDTMPEARKIDVYEESKVQQIKKPDVAKIDVAVTKPVFSIEEKTDMFLEDIENCSSKDDLKLIWDEVNTVSFKSHPELLAKLLQAKDAKKADFEDTEKFLKELDGETVEVIE